MSDFEKKNQYAGAHGTPKSVIPPSAAAVKKPASQVKKSEGRTRPQASLYPQGFADPDFSFLEADSLHFQFEPR